MTRPSDGKNRTTFLQKLALVLAVALFVIASGYAGFFEGMNTYLYDLAFRLRGNKPPSNKILIVAIDDKTLDHLGRWPIRRMHYVSLLERSVEADVVAFDIIMAEHSGDDNALLRAMEKHGKVVLPVYMGVGLKPHYPVQPLKPLATGHVHVEQGVDSVVRGVHHMISQGDTRSGSFSAAIYDSVSSLKPVGPTPRAGERRHREVQNGTAIQSDYMMINFCGGPGTFETISLWDALNGVYPKGFFRNKIILVGIVAEGLGDYLPVPFSQDRRNMSGVEIQANSVNTLLMGDMVRIVPSGVLWPIVLIISFLAFVSFLGVTERKGATLAILMLCLLTGAVYFLFTRRNIWLPPMELSASIPLVYLAAYATKYNDAVHSLNEAYAGILPHLRWVGGADHGGAAEEGMGRILTTKGVRERINLLGDVSRLLVLEKVLTDKALFSDFHGVILFGPDGKRMIANDRALSVFRSAGISTESVERFLGELTPSIPEKNGAPVFLCLSGEGTRDTFSLSLAAPKRMFLDAEFSSLHVDEKQYLLFLFSDITRIKEMEIMKGEIVSVVSHELKAPMTTIQGFSEMLTQTLQGEAKEFAQIIHQESGRLARFINTFLDVSRMEEGRQGVKHMPVRLNEVAAEVVHSLLPVAREKDMDILVEAPAELTILMIDRDLTKQCVLNLCENAIKYSPPKNVITVRISEQAETITLDVADHGYGIDREDLDKVFRKFFRSRSEATGDVPGSGLGLAFVKEAVEAQGGTVRAESAIGQGSVFSIVFTKER